MNTKEFTHRYEEGQRSFSETIFEGLDLSKYREIRNVYFSGATLSGARLMGCNFHECSFANATLSASSFKDSKIIDCTFIGSIMPAVDFRNTIIRSEFRGALMTRSAFLGSRMTGSVFEACELPYCDFGAIIWTHLRLVNTNLARSRFDLAVLERANFTGSDLTEVSFEKATLTEAKFQGTILREADMKGANLRSAKGIFVYGPSPTSGRMLYMVEWPEGKWMAATGCFWGSTTELRAAVQRKHQSPWYNGIIDLHLKCF